ncbi:MAG: beta strand repeat-containing protein [Nitrosotalea sp.]
MAPSLQYQFTQSGLDDIVDRIKELHNELRNGQITYQQYHTQIKEATEQGRAATQEFSQMKGAIAATNPKLLEYTRTMSTFGSVANTVLGITNAINLAQMASMGIDQTVMQDKVNLAAVTNNAAKDLAAFGQNSAQYQTDLAAKDADTNKLAYDLQQMGYQSVSTGATLVASAVSVAGSISQTLIGFKAMQAMMGGNFVENFAIGLSAVGTAALAILGPIAIVTAAIYGIYYAYQALDPAFAQQSSAIYNAIIANWHLDTLSATLIAPWVTFLVDLEGTADAMYNVMITLYNGIITGFINPLISAWDSTIGHITGSIAQITPSALTNQTLQQAMAAIGLGSATTTTSAAASSSSTTSSSMDAVNQMMLSGNLPGNSLTGSSTTQSIQQIQNTSAQQLQQQLISGSTSAAILQTQQATGATLTGANSNLVTISSSISSNLPPITSAVNTTGSSITNAVIAGTTATTSGLSSLQTAMTAAQTAQQNAVTAALSSIQSQISQYNSQIASLQTQATALAAQPQIQYGTDVGVTGYEGGPDGQPIYGTIQTQGPTAAASQLASVNQQIASLQQQATALTNQAKNVVANSAISGTLDVASSGAQATIASLGLDSSTGIGSIIAGALGNGSGSGTYAGINANQLAQFAQTGNYGIFGQAVDQEMAPGTITTYNSSGAPIFLQNTPANQLSVLEKNYQSMGFSASQSATYAAAVKENSNNFNGSIRSPGNNGGYGAGNQYLAAGGFEGNVNTPTSITVGEQGPEAVSITPLSKPGSGTSGNTIIINIAGSLLSDNDLAQTIDNVMKNNLIRVGFT